MKCLLLPLFMVPGSCLAASIGVPTALFESASSNSSTLAMTTKIFGGTEVPPFKYPWMVSISQFGTHGCGGALISPRVVLTAAHCNALVFGGKAGGDVPGLDKIFGVTAHRHDLSKPAASEQAVQLKLVKIYNHPQYKYMDEIPPWNDIALWHVSGGDGLIKQFGKLSFNDSAFTAGKEKAFTAGWGLSSYGEDEGPWSAPLKQVTLPYVKQAQCIKSLELPPNIRLTSICAGGVKGQSSCSGDSGSPLMIKKSNGYLNIIGVTSAGGMCGVENMPALYTRVSLYKDWITKTMKEIDSINE